nr:hypothetical protein [Deltaproteobacteria bacterium]
MSAAPLRSRHTMATPKRTRTSPPTASPKPAPKALVERARTLHEARRQRLAADGFDAIARVRERRADISASFYDVGEALVVLQREGIAEALGCADFDAICRDHLDLSPSHARRLVDLVARLTRGLAVSLGVDRASALMALVDATPDDDAPADILHATLVLPSGAKLDVDKAPTEAIYAAAKELRQAAAPSAKRARGLTTSAAERSRFAAATKRAAGDARFEGIEPRLVARGRVKGAAVRVDVPLDLWEAMVSAVVRAKKTR